MDIQIESTEYLSFNNTPDVSPVILKEALKLVVRSCIELDMFLMESVEKMVRNSKHLCSKRANKHEHI